MCHSQPYCNTDKQFFMNETFNTLSSWCRTLTVQCYNINKVFHRYDRFFVTVRMSADAENVNSAMDAEVFRILQVDEERNEVEKLTPWMNFHEAMLWLSGFEIASAAPLRMLMPELKNLSYNDCQTLLRSGVRLDELTQVNDTVKNCKFRIDGKRASLRLVRKIMFPALFLAGIHRTTFHGSASELGENGETIEFYL